VHHRRGLRGKALRQLLDGEEGISHDGCGTHARCARSFRNIPHMTSNSTQDLSNGIF
jgi:hypothetical protein